MTAEARTRVLRRIGGGQGGESVEAAYQALAAERARPELDESDLVALFSQSFPQQQGEVHPLASMSSLPAFVGTLVTEPTPLVMDDDPELAALDWEAQPLLYRREWKDVRDGGIGVSRGLCAVAETGTVVCASGPGSPASIIYLANQHVVVVRRRELVRFLDDAWALLRDRFGHDQPRGVFLLSGPSCTADVGGIITFGVHGPLRLHAVLVED
jgi:L-lactate dehydrogenase complex protein LldG